MIKLKKRGFSLALATLTLAGSLIGCANGPSTDTHDPIARAFRERRSNVQVTAEGEVTRVLSDDTAGSQHQRFIVRLASGQTVLIQHNIDLAPRVADLTVGDTIRFYGEYEWNEQGGLIHWTHHDPAGRHPDGWLELRGRTYR